MSKIEASFTVLIMSMASAAEISMGLMPDPQTNTTHVDKNLARFNIDMLQLLKEKTQGNLSKEEDQFLVSILHKLQTEFIKLK